MIILYGAENKISSDPLDPTNASSMHKYESVVVRGRLSKIDLYLLSTGQEASYLTNLTLNI